MMQVMYSRPDVSIGHQEAMHRPNNTPDWTTSTRCDERLRCGAEHSTPLMFQTVVGEPDADPADIRESVIHEIWRTQQFRTDDLQTVDGRRVVVIDPGRLNDDQGPDFLDARIIVGDTTWVGSVEIHRASTEWKRHRHHEDPGYHSVILHVTLVADRSTGRLLRNDGSTIPEIVLFPRLRESLRKLQWQFRKGGHMFFACHEHWMKVPDLVIAPFLERLALDRLKRKAARFGERFLSMPDLDQVLYEEIFRCLGYVQNSEAMVLLARRVPLSMLGAVPDPRDGAALLLGSAGLLHSGDVKQPSDADSDLLRRFEELADRGAPDPLPRTIWRNARLRPANSPRRRILQAALLLGPWGRLGPHVMESAGGVLEAEDPGSWLRSLLDFPRDVAAYVAPGGSDKELRIGLERRVTIVANAILPLLLLQSEQWELSDAEQRSMEVLHKLPVVMDQVVRRYSGERGRPVSTCVGQGLHELSRSWCGEGKCRECPIWKHIASPQGRVR